MEDLTATDVIGRAAELGVIQEFLADIEHGPRALVLSGEAGIGKTVLWEAGVDDARGRFDSILTCRGVEAEASLSFAGLSELLGDVLDEVAPSLAPPRRRALEVALLLAEPGETAPDAHAIGLAVLDVLRALADRGPCLVALDDIQWLDPASAGALQIALRRLRDGAARAARDAQAGAGARGEPGRARALVPGRAARAADGRPVEPRRSASPARGAARARADEAGARPRAGGDGGQPVLRAGARPRARAHEHATGSRPAAARAREPARAARRQARAPPRRDARRPAARRRARAADGRAGGGDLRRSGARPGGARRRQREEAVVELDDANVRFAHPLLGSICYERAPLWKRRAVHRALAAEVLGRRGARPPPRARRGRPRRDDRFRARGRRRACGCARGARRGGRALRARCRAGARRIPPLASEAAHARGRSLPPRRRRRARGRDVRAVLLRRLPPGLERADILFGLAFTAARRPRP